MEPAPEPAEARAAEQGRPAPPPAAFAAATAQAAAGNSPEVGPVASGPEAQREAAPVESAEAEAGISSRLCGLFYLINLMVSHDLPACFEEDWALASAAGPWAVLEGLGRGLLGANYPPVADDGVWRALAALDGRPPEALAGDGLPGCDRLRLPEHWQVDTPAEPGPVPGLAACSPALARWVSLVLPYFHALLHESAGITPLELMAAPGQIYVTRSHLDVVMPMDSISLKARLAGLDRNPGWQRDWGRVIYFHFQ